MSYGVLALPSSHVDPSGLSGFEQTPVDGLQVPTAWHWSLAVQVIGFAPTQTPAWHVSVWVQRVPSSQAVPSATAVWTHWPVDGLHAAVWQPSIGVQVTPVQALPVV
jgi:hypothetical protein